MGLLSLVLLCAVLGVRAELTDNRVTVLKCCQNDEELTVPQDRDVTKTRCAKTENPWSILIYSPSKRELLDNIPDNWKIGWGKWPQCSSTQELSVVNNIDADPFVTYDNGSVFRTIGNTAPVPPSEYCLDSKALILCVPRKTDGRSAATSIKPRVHRCCGANAAYHRARGACVNMPDKEDALPLLPNASSILETVEGFPQCARHNNYSIIGNAKDAKLAPDGSLTLDGNHLPMGQYCIEKMEEVDQPAKVIACLEHVIERSPVQATDIRFTLYPVGFIISAIFLAATLAAGWLLPASHHVLHWRCQTHHVACLMLGSLLMAIIQLAGNSIHGVECKAIAILAHFFFLAAFFWLNTMCFNIWWTFRDLRPSSLEKGQETLRLRVYACYAWGGPLLVAGLAALLDHLPPQPQYTFLRPRFGEKVCWFYGDMEMLAYFFGPIGVLLAVNLIFFAATARELTCGLWKGEFVKSTTERAALGRVCMKLVVVMGVTWVMDVISWAVGGPQYLWYVTDMINAFQGVFIFVVVGCQPQVRSALKRFCSRNPRTNAGRQGNGLSTTSHGMPSMGDSVTQNPSTKTAPLETIC